MAVIHDVIPAFELFQPTSVDDALALQARHGAKAWVLAGGLDSFDWFKDRIKRPEVVDRSEPGQGTARRARGGRRPGDRRDDHADRSGAPSDGSGEVQHPAECGRSGRLAADSQSGHDRRQRLAGCPLLVLPRRLAVLSRRRQHLLRGYADGPESRARHPRRRSLRGRESVGHGARADRARREDWSFERRRASASSMPKIISSARRPTSPG